MNLNERINELAGAMGVDVKGLKQSLGDVTGLTTAAKTNLVLAINEVNAKASAPAGAIINDSAASGPDVVYSVDKIISLLAAADLKTKNDLLGGAGEAFDTLGEIAAAFNNNPNFAAEMVLALNKRVRVDAVQTFTVTEKKQGCDNLGLGDPDTDFVAAYNAAKV